MFSLIYSFVIAGAAVLLVFTGLFLLIASRDLLVVRYQNFRLSVTGRPLKDEDFPNISRLVNSLRVAGLFCFVIGVAVLTFSFVGR